MVSAAAATACAPSVDGVEEVEVPALVALPRPVMSLIAAWTPCPAALTRFTASVIGLSSGASSNGAGIPGFMFRL